MRRTTVLTITLGLMLLATAAPATAQGASPVRRMALWSENEIEGRDLRLVRPTGIAWDGRARRLVVSDRTSVDTTTLRALTTLGRTTGRAVVRGGARSFGIDPRSGARVVLPDTADRLVVTGAGAATADRAGGGRAVPLADPRGAIDAIGFGVDGRGYAVRGRAVLRLDRGRDGSLDGTITPVAVIRGGPARISAIAVDRDGRFLLLEAGSSRLWRAMPDGRVTGVRDLRPLGALRPRALAFAPSADSTDPVAEQSLYVLDAGRRVGRRLVGSGVVELTSVAPLSVGALGRIVLRETFLTSGWNPPSPDPMGLTYDVHRDKLIITDSEVEEMPNLWANANGFVAGLGGALTDTFNLRSWNTEPVDIAYDETTRTYYVSNDSKQQITVITAGGDEIFWTADDVRRTFGTLAFGSRDPEGIGFGDGALYIGDGSNKHVWRLRPGGNGRIDGGGDDLIDGFDTEALGVRDPEGIDYMDDTGTLIVVSRTTADPVIETTVTGDLVRSFDAGVLGSDSLSGVAWGPSSADPDVPSLYATDRGVDNNDDPNENDGKVYEFGLETLSGGANLLQNPGFEQDADGNGPDGWKTESSFQRASGQVLSGSWSGRHQSGANVGYTTYQVVPNVSGGDGYVASGWVNIPPTGDGFTFKVRVQWRNASNQTITTRDATIHKNATDGWEGFALALTAPSDADRARIMMVVSSLNATIHVDDFSFGN